MEPEMIGSCQVLPQLKQMYIYCKIKEYTFGSSNAKGNELSERSENMDSFAPDSSISGGNFQSTFNAFNAVLKEKI